MRKIIFLDVDGTLVDYQNRLPESAGAAVKAARANGHLVYACTGRSKAEMPDFLWELGLDGMIGANGGYVEHEGQVVFHQSMDAVQEAAVVDWLEDRDLPFYLEANDGLFASGDFKERVVPVLRKYVASKGQDPDDVTVDVAFHGMRYGEDLYREGVNKISFILNSYEDHLASAEAFPDLEAHTWGGRGEEALFGDLGVKGIDKAVAVGRLVEFLGARMEDTIAFGDAKIDIPMLETCEIGVAMGNGGPEILAMADMVTADVEDDGLWKAFVQLGLVEG